VDAVAALRVLPRIAEDTRAMASHTALLREVVQAIGNVGEDTAALPALRRDMARVAKGTGVLGPMDDRMATIEEAMPVLVEVQQHLSELPETIGRLDERIGRLDERIDRLSGLLDRMFESLDGLNQGVSTLQQSLAPVGRLAQRLPGQSKDNQG
jgi:DNA repair ATPase RecN